MTGYYTANELNKKRGEPNERKGSMIVSLLKKGKIDMEEAEEINLCCAARLDCKALTLEE